MFSNAHPHPRYQPCEEPLSNHFYLALLLKIHELKFYKIEDTISKIIPSSLLVSLSQYSRHWHSCSHQNPTSILGSSTVQAIFRAFQLKLLTPLSLISSSLSPTQSLAAFITRSTAVSFSPFSYSAPVTLLLCAHLSDTFSVTLVRGQKNHAVPTHSGSHHSISSLGTAAASKIPLILIRPWLVSLCLALMLSFQSFRHETLCSFPNFNAL